VNVWTLFQWLGVIVAAALAAVGAATVGIYIGEWRRRRRELRELERELLRYLRRVDYARKAAG
jgi:hypothetical protein